MVKLDPFHKIEHEKLKLQIRRSVAIRPFSACVAVTAMLPVQLVMNTV